MAKYKIGIRNPSRYDYTYNCGHKVTVYSTRMEEVTKSIAHCASKEEAEALIAGLEAKDGEPASITYDDRTTTALEEIKKPIRKWWGQ